MNNHMVSTRWEEYINGELYIFYVSSITELDEIYIIKYKSRETGTSISERGKINYYLIDDHIFNNVGKTLNGTYVPYSDHKELYNVLIAQILITLGSEGLRLITYPNTYQSILNSLEEDKPLFNLAKFIKNKKGGGKGGVGGVGKIL